MATLTQKLKEYYYNNDTSAAITLTLENELSCSSGFVKVANFAQIIKANTEAKVNFPKDGIYKVFIDDVEDNTLGGSIPYYTGLFTSMILYVSASLCDETGINCLAVTQCTGEKANVLNNALGKEILYMSSYGSEYYSNYDGTSCAGAMPEAMRKIDCSARVAYDKLYKQETLMGVSVMDSILKIEIAELYLAMYHRDKANLVGGTVDEINELYSYSTVLPCINKLGINENTVITEPCGIPHTAWIKAAPIYTQRGVLTDILITYNLNPKDDTFINPTTSNVTGATDISTFDGNTRSVVMPTSQDTVYYIDYTYKRGNSEDTGRVSVSIDAREPQWFGGESATPDFTVNNSVIDESSLVFANSGVKKYQNDSNATTSNVNTQNKYIWWITKNKVDIAPAGLGALPQGDFNTTDCSVGAPSTYAIIWKEGDVRLIDGTIMTYNFYRTCPVQDLVDQTSINEIIQR